MNDINWRKQETFDAGCRELKLPNTSILIQDEIGYFRVVSFWELKIVNSKLIHVLPDCDSTIGVIKFALIAE